jgi:diguanylate cyclase (GGDEF)-like protein
MSDTTWQKHKAEALAQTDPQARYQQLEQVLSATTNPLEQAEILELQVEALDRLNTPNNHEDKLQVLQRAKQIYEDSLEVPSVIRVLRRIGNTQTVWGDFTGALEHYLRALELSQQSADRQQEGNIIRLMAVMYGLSDNLERAQYYFSRFEHEFADIHSEQDAWLNPVNLGDTHIELAKLAEKRGDQEAAEAERLLALPLFAHSLEVAQHQQHQQFIAWSHWRLADALRLLGRFAVAREQAEAAIQLAQATNYHYVRYAAYQTLGETTLSDNSIFALGLLQQAVTGFEAMKLAAEQAAALKALAAAFAYSGDYQKAYQYHQQFHALELQVQHKKAEQRFEATTLRLELERARNEAALVRLESFELKKQQQLLERRAQELGRLAETDGLTGVHNRRALEAQLKRWCEAAEVSPTDVITAILFDVDYFKKINDQFLHATGDAVLRQLGQILRQFCRSSDLCARYGGEEFVLVLRQFEQSQSFEICERLRWRVQTHPWHELHPELSVTLSIGFAHFVAGMSAHDLLAKADAFQYQAKQSGRNQTQPRPVV